MALKGQVVSRSGIAFALLLTVTIVVGYLWLIWQAPLIVVPELGKPVPAPAGSPAPGLTAGERATAAHNARLLMVSIAGAVVVIVGLLYTARNYRLSHRGQVTDRFTKALERLGSPELYVRIGGVHALDQVLHDSPDQHAHIVDVLVAFIRHRTAPARQHPDTANEKVVNLADLPSTSVEPEPDVQAALTALAGRRRRRREQRPINLTELHIERADLGGARLQGANLSQARLQRANLRGARLQGAHLIGTHLQNANLSQARLQDAYLSEAQLQDAYLSEAQLQGANLVGAHLQNANLSEARLQDAYLSEARLKGAYLIGARLEGANLVGARLQDANLVGAQLPDANLGWARLQGANLSEAQLQGTNLRGAQLQGANLVRAQLRNANLSWAGLQGADLRGAQLQGANLVGAHLQGANLIGAHLEDADLSGAQLRGADLIWAQLQGANLSGAQLQNAYLGGLLRDGTTHPRARVTGHRAQGLTLGQLLGTQVDENTGLPEGLWAQLAR